MEERGNGVHIGLREIYDKLETVATDVKMLQTSMEKVEEQGVELKAVRAIAEKAEEDAERALTLVTKHDNNISWLWKTVIGVLITGILGGVLTLFFVLIQNSLLHKVPTNPPAEEQELDKSSVGYVLLLGGEIIED